MDRSSANQIPETIFVVMTAPRLRLFLIRIYVLHCGTRQLFTREILAEMVHVQRVLLILALRKPQIIRQLEQMPSVTEVSP